MPATELPHSGLLSRETCHSNAVSPQPLVAASSESTLVFKMKTNFPQVAPANNGRYVLGPRHYFFLSSPEDMLMNLKREKGKDREKERNSNVREKHQLVASPMHPTPNWGWTYNLGMCPNQGSNPWPFSLWDNAMTNGATPATFADHRTSLWAISKLPIGLAATSSEQHYPLRLFLSNSPSFLLSSQGSDLHHGLQPVSHSLLFIFSTYYL